MKKKILVFGFGHSPRASSDVAVCVIDYLRQRSNTNNLELLDSNSCDKNLSECIESTEQLIVIDANHAHTRPGSVKVYEGFEMDAFVTHRKNDDTHEANLRDALNAALLNGKLPRHRALIGIQASSFDAHELDETDVNQVINQACHRIFEITEYWKI
ncbi:MAG: hydrogenase maturation protease [Pseudomonadota bacterium]|nr:hydrogenase maturation protease [Pseudomonadota bacterium]